MKRKGIELFSIIFMKKNDRGDNNHPELRLVIVMKPIYVFLKCVPEKIE